MTSVEDLVDELKALSPGQLHRVARLVHEISGTGSGGTGPIVEAAVIEKAVRNGWPADLFTEVIQVNHGTNIERWPQDFHEVRRIL